MSYCISRSAYRWHLAERALLLNSHVRAEKAMMRVNGRAWRYEVNLSTAKIPPGIPDQSVTFFRRSSTISAYARGFRPFPEFG